MNFKKTAAIVAAAGALTALAVPAMAEITPFGSVRLLVGYQSDSKEIAGKTNTDIFFKMPNTTRFGVKGSSNDLGFVIEMGINENVGAVYNRLMFGTYKMSAGTLLVGQDYTKSWNPSAAITEDRPSNGGWGNFYDGRTPQIRFQADSGLYAAVIKPSVVPALTAAKVLLPKLNVGYDGKAGDVGYGAGIEYQTYKNETLSKNINSFLVYTRASMTSGPVALKANLGYGSNLGDMGFTGLGYSVGKNTTRLEGYVQGGYTISPMLKVQLIIGGASEKNSAVGPERDNNMQILVNLPITVAKNFTITPEISVLDNMKSKTDTDQGSSTYAGAKFQLDF